MAVKMVALRRCYVPSLQGEYEAHREFEAVDEREARRLERRRLARVLPAGKQPQRADQKPTQETDALEVARSRYRASTGRDPDMRWGLARLESELSVSPSVQTYNRRDMRAEDE